MEHVNLCVCVATCAYTRNLRAEFVSLLGTCRRLYAQAATLSALVAGAGVELYDRSTREPAPVDTASYEHQQKLKQQSA